MVLMLVLTREHSNGTLSGLYFKVK